MPHGDGRTTWQKNERNRLPLLVGSTKCAGVVRNGVFEGLWAVGKVSSAIHGGESSVTCKMGVGACGVQINLSGTVQITIQARELPSSLVIDIIEADGKC